MHTASVRVDGQVALVTGGATGIGYAVAETLKANGATVYLAGRRRDAGEQAAAQLEARFIELDVTDTASVELAVGSIVELEGRLDIDINSAGAGGGWEAESITDEEWRRVFDVNLDGVFRTCRAVGKVMIGQGSGAIVNIASMSGVIVNHPQKSSPYNTAKAGVIHFSRSIAMEWAPYGIRVNVVSPGYTVTAMTRYSRSQPDRIKAWLERVPLNRLADPVEMAGAVAFLASPAASYITGQNLVADGGYSVW
ncbi:MAG: SDR family oxidoreductase [Propionibacteriaceae bacterium]|nr:SDR family oxidoreductase [Propionibacteriaceae bacterium]